jgi:predicted aminopeptidase
LRNFLRKNIKKLIIGTLIFVFVSGIVLYSIPITRYLLTQGYYQSKIIFSRKNVSDLVNDPKTDPRIREKLREVDEIKKFGLELGLKETGSYKTIYDTGGQPAVWAVSACPKDRFEAVQWNFPIVGKVPYLGYFKKDDALKMQQKLKDKGLDTICRPVGAYSSLGIISDPLFTSMLLGSEEYLANTIIHEMTHSTVFVKDDMNFNESLASFVGNAGGMEYLKHKYGADSEQVVSSLNFKKDDEIFSGFMADLYDELDKFYKSGITSQEKITGREAIFEKYRQKFRDEIKPRLKTKSYDYFETLKFNNAYILFNRCYHRDYNIFDDLYALQGKDLKKTIEWLKTLKPDKEMKKKIEEEVKRLKSSST